MYQHTFSNPCPYHHFRPPPSMWLPRFQYRNPMFIPKWRSAQKGSVKAELLRTKSNPQSPIHPCYPREAPCMPSLFVRPLPHQPSSRVRYIEPFLLHSALEPSTWRRCRKKFVSSFLSPTFIYSLSHTEDLNSSFLSFRYPPPSQPRFDDGRLLRVAQHMLSHHDLSSVAHPAGYAINRANPSLDTSPKSSVLWIYNWAIDALGISRSGHRWLDIGPFIAMGSRFGATIQTYTSFIGLCLHTRRQFGGYPLLSRQVPNTTTAVSCISQRLSVSTLPEISYRIF